jgi:hypothetical protein
MNGEPETKVCRQCAETIRAKAKLCPYCRSRQNGIGVWQNEILSGGIAIFWLIFAGLVCVFLGPRIAGGHQYWLHRADLQVLGTRFDRIVTTNAPSFALTGYVTNSGDYAWRVEEFEVRFVDASGGPLDVEHTDDDFVVQPKQAHAFRIVLYDLAVTNPNIANLVRVTRAIDGNQKNWLN